MRRKIKILFLIDELQIGGTEKQIILLSEAFSRERFDPVVGILKGNSYTKSLNLQTPIVKFNWPGLPFVKNVSLVWKLKRYIENEKFDILQTHFVDSEIHGTMAVRHCRKPPVLINTRRNLYHWIKEDPWKFRITKRIVQWTDRVVANSYKAFEKCQEIECIPPDKITVIHNGVDVDKFNTIPCDEAKKILGLNGAHIVIGAVGNWRPVKGFVSFFKAAALVSKKIENARFILIGSGPQENELKQLTRDLGIRNRVTFMKNSQDIPKTMAAFDVAVQPSLSESFSNVLIEYMAAAKPIVATSVGDAELVIENSKEGILVRPNNPDQLSNAILNLCNEKTISAQMGRNARIKVTANWSYEKMVAKYQAFYQELINPW